MGFTYMDYLERILKPWYERHQGNTASLEELSAQCRLDSLAGILRDNPDVRLFQNRNDFLITEEDLPWYQETLGSRFLLFPRGSHLGNMFLPEYQEALLQALQP